MKKILFILFTSIICANLISQDTIYFNDSILAVDFSDSINKANAYPRQDALRFQDVQYNSNLSLYYHLINKVSTKGLSESDSAWMPMLDVNINDTLWHNSVMYKARQTHYTTIGWEPPNVLALWLRIATDSLWYAGVEYEIDDTSWYSDVQYKCIQFHVSQVGWEPPNVPALWSEIIPPSSEWQNGYAYIIDNIVTYDGTEYICIQAHTSNMGWIPPNTLLILWNEN